MADDPQTDKTPSVDKPLTENLAGNELSPKSASAAETAILPGLPKLTGAFDPIDLPVALPAAKTAEPAAPDMPAPGRLPDKKMGMSPPGNAKADLDTPVANTSATDRPSIGKPLVGQLAAGTVAPAKTGSAKFAKNAIATGRSPVLPKNPQISVPVVHPDQVQLEDKASSAPAAVESATSLPPVANVASAVKPKFLKEIFNMTNPNFDFAAAFKTAFSDAQDKAKDAYEKSTVALGDANDFAKGNVEALVESTKILASGLQELTTEMVAESREAFESLTAEVKTLATVKSPADFFKLQSELMRKQMDALMANGTKHSEAFLKLASDAAAPLSSRVSLAVEKVKSNV